MKTFYAVLISVVFAAAACGKGKKEEPKVEPETKPTEPAKADPAAPAPTPTPDPAAAAPETPPAGGATMSVDEAGAKATAFFDKMAKAVEDSGGDCAKMATNLKPLEGEAKEMASASKTFDADAAKKKEFDEKFGTKIMEKFTTLGPKLTKCQDNAEVKAFFTNLGA